MTEPTPTRASLDTANGQLRQHGLRVHLLWAALLTVVFWVGPLYLLENAFVIVPWVTLYRRARLLYTCLHLAFYALDALFVLLAALPLLYGCATVFDGATEGRRLPLSTLFCAFSSHRAYLRSLGAMLMVALPRAVLALCIYFSLSSLLTSPSWATAAGAFFAVALTPCALWFLGTDDVFLRLTIRCPDAPLLALYHRASCVTRHRLGAIFRFKMRFLGLWLLSLLSLGVLFFSHALPLYCLAHNAWWANAQQSKHDLADKASRYKKGWLNTMENQKFYMTTAIAYASKKPHFGNTYEAIMTDALARYRRERGYDVFMCTGTDEHGQKIEDLAKDAGITPKAYVDGVAGEIKNLWDGMNVKYDHFIRTTDDYHEDAVKKIFTKFLNKGDIYKGKYEGWYCVPCESFFTDTQAEGCKCPDCGRPVERASEEAYFFDMKKYADRLMDYIEAHPEFIEPESRKKEIVNNFLKAGLQDLCVSRTSFTWGIPVETDPKHVTYVWLDALTNYITAIGYDPDKSFEEQSEKFKKLWPADVHIIGKDIIRFHTIYWPIFLMALDLPLPKKVFAHPWFNFGADKMSKSRGNVIYADELAEHFTVDGVRYYALSEMPYANDGSITYENVIKRFNTDLVNNLGNLVKRTLDMQKKYFEGVIQAPTAKEALDDEVIAACVGAYDKVLAHMDAYRIADALDAIFTMLSRANKYIDETTPWSLAKDESQRERLGTVLYTLLETIRWGAVLLKPFIPATAEEILSELCTNAASYATIGTAEQFGALVAGERVGESRVLFARIDEAKKLEEFEAIRKAQMEAAAKAEAPVEKPEGCALIGIEDFMNVELRTAKIIACESVPKAKKLLKLQVDLGYEQRQVVSGIAKWYTPEQLIGKKIILVANLRPATLCGVESNGMILASGEETVRVVFLDSETPLGERVR